MEISKLIVLLVIVSTINFACSTSRPPVDADGRPLIVKTGTVDCDLVKQTGCVS